MAQKFKTSRVGNKINSGINGEWARHIRKWGKRVTSHIRRQRGRKEIKDRLENE